MVSYHRQLLVPVPVDEAFAYLSRFSSAAQWDPNVRSATMLSPEPVRLGSTFELTLGFLGRVLTLRYEITNFDRPHRVALTTMNHSAHATTTISCHPGTETGTTTETVIDYQVDLRLSGVTWLATPLFALPFARLNTQATDGLQAALNSLARPTVKHQTSHAPKSPPFP